MLEAAADRRGKGSEFGKSRHKGKGRVIFDRLCKFVSLSLRTFIRAPPPPPSVKFETAFLWEKYAASASGNLAHSPQNSPFLLSFLLPHFPFGIGPCKEGGGREGPLSLFPSTPPMYLQSDSSHHFYL